MRKGKGRGGRAERYLVIGKYLKRERERNGKGVCRKRERKEYDGNAAVEWNKTRKKVHLRGTV